MKYLNAFLFSVIVAFASISVINAETRLSGKKELVFYDGEENPLIIGHILFHKNGNKIFYSIEFIEGVFSDEFLSMRPFKCIHATKQMICHLVYPYEKQGYITTEDLTDLEYDLLFLHKSESEYGINAWNGLYYRLQINSDYISGVLNEVDLNVLAAPPDEGVLRPITQDMLYEADPEHHTFPKLKIK